MVQQTVALGNGQPESLDEITDSCSVSEDAAPLRHVTGDVVSPSYTPKYYDKGVEQWFLMRAAYGQEKKAYNYLLDKEGIEEVFYPQWYQERTIRGKKKKVLVSVLPNTLFVKSTQGALHRYIGIPPLTFFHHYYQRYLDANGREIESGRKPIIIPDSQIILFRKWLDADAEDKIYINDTFVFKKDDIVRVKEGSFAGFTGHIVRLKGQTRVGVNIDGVGFISTAYIPKHCLEKIERLKIQ